MSNKVEKPEENGKQSFLSKLLSNGSDVSSKRVMGVLCIIFAMILVICSIFLTVVGEIHDSVSPITIQFLGAGVALFGVTAIDNLNKNE